MGLRASEHKWSLITLYLITLLMRASFYLSLAVIQDTSYMGGILSSADTALVVIIYPLVELATVSYFGAKSDKIGRKPILVASLFLTSLAAFLFAMAPTAIFLFFFTIIFGLGVASKVTTTLSMIADCSTEDNRARLMGYYDLSTLMGLAGGYGLGILLTQFGIEAVPLLIMASIACLIGGFIAYFGLGETRVVSHIEVSVVDLLRKVARDRRVQLMLPVFVPIISLYGLMIANVKHILSTHFTLSNEIMLILFALLGGSLFIGVITLGHLSDHYRKRKPFIVSGLLAFGFLAYLLISYADNFEDIFAFWPIIPLLGFVAGGFPPAAMAYLTDLSDEDSRGSTMGVYSIFFGAGMVIGPSTGAFVYETYGLPGFIVLIAIFIVIACIGTYFMPELHGYESSKPMKEI